MRPHAQRFLRKVSQWFEVIVFTASQPEYADQVLEWLDPGREWVHHRLYRQHCSLVDGVLVKDLRILGCREESHLIIVDNNPHCFGFHLDNGVPIKPWVGDPTDTQLLSVLKYLNTLRSLQDVRVKNRQTFGLQYFCDYCVPTLLLHEARH